MESDPSHIDYAAKKKAIDRLISEIMARDPGKGRLNESAIVAKHPELMPELRTALRNLSAMRAGQTASMVVKTSIGQAGAAVTAPAGITIAGYEIERELGWGGQAVVYLAVRKNTGRKVAIKIMRPEALSDERALARFQREVRVLAALDHPNIVGILDTGVTAEGNHYIAMNYVAGSTLDEYMQARLRGDSADAGKIAGELLRMFLKICEAVNSAHVRGIVHRDLKPGNIRIDERGEPHVLDFGLAHTALDRLAGGEHPVAVTGEFLGSLPWCSPEQAEGDPDRIDIRSDVYSLGVILYQILTGGKFPYEVVGNIRDVLNNILNSEPTPPSKVARSTVVEKSFHGTLRLGRMGPPAVNETIERIVLKSLSKNRELRYQTAGELGHDVENYLAGQPTTVSPAPTKSRSKRWLVPAAAAVLLMAACAAGVGFWLKSQKPMVTAAAPPPTTTLAGATPRPTTNPPAAGAPTFTQSMDQSFTLIQGSCHLDGDALVLTPGKTQGFAEFSTTDWSNYDLTFSAMTGEPSDGDGFRVIIHGMRGNGCHFWVGRAMNTEFEISSKLAGVNQRLAWQPCRIEPDRWYQVRVEVRGPAIRCFLNGKECLTGSDSRFTHGRVGLAVLQSGVKFRQIKLSAPDGTILWQGPPDLSQLPAGEVDPPGTFATPDMRKTDLLKAFSPATDAAAGQRAATSDGITGHGANARLQFRQALPPEYDYRVTFVRAKADGPMALIASQDGNPFAWIIGGHEGTIMGFGQVNGMDYDNTSNLTRHQLSANLADGEAHTLVLRVRKDAVRAYIDGQQLIAINAILSTLSLPPFLSHTDAAPLGIWLGGDAVTVKSADLFELTKKPIAGPNAADR